SHVIVALLLAVGAWLVYDHADELSPSTTDAPVALEGVVDVVAARPSVPGYDRDCGRGHGCVFGPAWSDDVDAPGGHNGCDTRNDILRRDLHDVVIKSGTPGCVVLTGSLADPYTGDELAFDRTRDAAGVQIDHVFPLAAAWDHGAAAWDSERRRRFANDPLNLLATTGSVNQSKGDSTPGQWMPGHERCRYARAYVAVAGRYGLTVSRGGAAALSEALDGC